MFKRNARSHFKMKPFQTSLQIHQAENVQEAVEMAANFKKGGRYNWFRGQVRGHYNPYATFIRLQIINDLNEIRKANRKQALFVGWLREQPHLKDLLKPEREDECVAIMQHYDIPTDLLDFT